MPFVILLLFWALASDLFGQPAPNLAIVERQAEQLVKSDPSAEHWQKLGLARFMQSKFPGALTAFEEAVRRQPALWTAHLFLGISRYRTNQFPTALLALETAKRLAPAKSPGLDDVDFWLGATYLAVGRSWDGLVALEVLLSRNPTHKDALAMSAKAYTELGGSLWNQIAEQHFETAQGQEVHGRVLEGQGNAAGALQAYRDSRTRNPVRPEPSLAMARLLLTEGKTTEARELLERVRSSGEPEASYLLGLTLLRQERLPEALPMLEAAASWARSETDVLLTLAQVRLALGDAAGALKAAQQALEIDPSAIAARELLEAAQKAL